MISNNSSMLDLNCPNAIVADYEIEWFNDAYIIILTNDEIRT